MKDWWKTNELQSSMDFPDQAFQGHPIFSQALKMNKSVTGVIDIRTMKYLFWSGNVKQLLGWEDQDYIDHGVQYSFTKLHPRDMNAIGYYTQLIHSYYRNLPEVERPAFRNYWDFRYLRPEGGYMIILQQDTAIHHDEAGNIGTLLIFVTDITNLKKDSSRHLRLTNGKENLLYEFDTVENKPIELICPSQRELEVFQLLGQSYSRHQIADKLGITLATTKTHCQHVFDKLKVSDSIEALGLLRIFGLI
jgi:DNA-binding CsgD family transcriptional regulator